MRLPLAWWLHALMQRLLSEVSGGVRALLGAGRLLEAHKLALRGALALQVIGEDEEESHAQLQLAQGA